MKLSERKRKDLRPTPAGDCVYFWLDDIEELEKLETQFEAELKAVKNDYERIKQLEAELEQWRAEHQDETDPKIRPMTRMENAWMDAEGKIGSLEAENAAAFELLDVYEKENERLRDEYKSVMSLIAMMVHQSGGELKVPMVLLRGDEELVTWNSGMDFYIKFDDALKEGE